MAGLEKRFPIYSRLLHFYPPSYRQEYAPQMLQTLADMLDDAVSLRERSRVWIQVTADLPLSMAKQDLYYLRGIIANETPSYIKRNALIGTALLLPFVLALCANTLDHALRGQDLYNSWLWHAPFLSLWVLWLPLLAALLALATLIVYIAQQTKQTSGQVYRHLLAAQYYWPLLVIALCGVGILAIVFPHDSVACVMHNPLDEVRHLQQTWQCIGQGSSLHPLDHPLKFLRTALFGN